MELAILLVFMVFLELACTVWLLARIHYGNRVAGKLSKRIDLLELKLLNMTGASTKDDVVPTSTPDELAGMLAALTPEQQEDATKQAAAILKSFGVDLKD